MSTKHQIKRIGFVLSFMACFIILCITVPAIAAEMIGETLSFEPGNHIYFYNIEGGAGSSDMILVESNGRWGLIDAGTGMTPVFQMKTVAAGRRMYPVSPVRLQARMVATACFT